MEQLNLYEILGVSQDADINVIREAYGKLVANPDIQKDAERFKAIGQAFEVLSHPEKRLAYDAAMQYERQEVKDNISMIRLPIIRQTITQGTIIWGAMWSVRPNPK